MEDNYISDLPEAPVLQMGLPEAPNLDKIFQTSLPQYTRVAEPKEPTREEKIASIADNISNSKLTSNYTPNVLAPIEVGIDTSKYEGVDISLAKLQSGSMEQYAAQSQSYWDRLWNDTKVTGANLGIGFATAFTSIYDMINDGSFIPGEDSATSNLGRISSKFAEENTNFQTQYDVDNPIKSLLLPSFLTGSSKGWGEIAKSASIGIGTGLGIVAQELAIGAVTGGIGSIPILANNIRNLIRGSKTIAQAAETASALRAGTTSIAQGVREIGALESAISTANTTKNIINFGKNTVRGALSAYGESAFEAQESRDSFTLDKIKEYKEKNGYLPSGADLDKIKNVAEQAHDARFLLNFGLLTFSNMPFNNSIFKQFDDVMSISEQAAAKGLKYTGKAADGFEKSFQLTSNWWSKNAVTKGMKTALETGQPYVKNIFTGKSITWTEGLEEGYQFWVDKATNNYYNTIYNKGTNDIIDGTLTDTVYGLANSFYKTKEQLISTEGLQNIIGGIMGGTGQSVFSKGLDTSKLAYQASKIASDPKNNTTFKKEYDKLTGQWKEGSQFRIDTTAQIKEGQKDLLDIQKAINLNSITGDLQSKIEAVRGAYTGAGLMEEVNSVVTFEKLKDITKFHTIAPMVMRGQSDILKEQLTSTLEDVSDDEFKLMTGLDQVTPGIKQQYISKVIEDVNKVEKSVKRNLSTFRNKYQKGTEEYNRYEDAKKVFAFHGYMSESMMERKKDLESKNSILFNAPNITAALELATQGTNREGLLDQIKQRKNQFESDIRIATPVIKEGEETEIDEQTQQLIERAQAQIDTLTELETEVNGFKGENVKEVIDLINNVFTSFNQLELIQDDSTLNLQNQLDKILNTFTDHQILSTNLAEHLETYNNLVQNYSDSLKLKETLDKYKEQGFIVQSSFSGLKNFNTFNNAKGYFLQRAVEVGLRKDSEFFTAIMKGMQELQSKNAELQEYTDLIDKNINQFVKEEQQETTDEDGFEEGKIFNESEEKLNENLQLKSDLLTFKNSLKNLNLVKDSKQYKNVVDALENLTIRYNALTKINEKDLNDIQKENMELFLEVSELAEKVINDAIPKSAEFLRNEEIDEELIVINNDFQNGTVIKDNPRYKELKNYLDDLEELSDEIGKQKEESNLKTKNLKNINYLMEKIVNIIQIADNAVNDKDINDGLNGDDKSIQLTKEGKNIFNYNDSTSKKEVEDKINAKYDAELETLRNQYSDKTIEQLEKEITDIRAQEQIDLNNEIPKFNSFKVDGKLDKNKLLGKDLVNYERIWNEYNTILTPLLAELKAKKAAKEKNKKPTNEKTGKVDTGSIKSKTLESIVYIDDKGKIISLKSPDGKEKGIKTAKKVSDTLQSGEEIDIEDLTFKLVTSTENKTTPLMWDKVFKRTSSEKAIQVTDSSNNFITLIQDSKTLLLNTKYILENKDIKLNPDLRTLLGGNPDISVVDAIKKGILDETLFDYLKTIKTITNKKEHSILVVTENFETFKNIMLKQSENFEKFLENPKKLKETFKELYSGLETFANGINDDKEGNYKEVAFTKGLPFNFIGEWNQPIFSISNNEITPLNGEELGVKRKPLREKINNVLKEIAEKNPNFYEVLINKGSYFTVFTDQNNKIWIKPISLKLDNAKEKIEEQIFQNEKVTEKTAGDVREKYNITTYHNKELVRIKIYEDKYNEKIVNISFSKKVNGETISYYLNEVNKENLTKILNDPSSVKPKLKKPLEGFSNELDLKDSKISIIKNSNKDDRLELITNGDYSVSDIDNPISIFQNVGFRLKFNEKQEEQNPIIPKSFIPETPTIASGKDSNKTEMEVKILEIEERRKANLEDTGDPFDSLSSYPRIDGRFNAIYNMPNKQIENEIFDTYQEAKDWINNKYNDEIKAVKKQYEITADELFAPTSPVQELANISREEIDNKKKELENQPLMNQFEIDNQTKTPVEGLNERLDAYGNAKVLLSNDFFEGKRPAGRLNAFKSNIDKVSDNLSVIKDLNLDEFDFISEEDKQKLNDLKPLAEELLRINNLTISSADTRTVAVEKRYAQLSNQLSNDFVSIMNKYVKDQLGKEISSSKPSLIQQSNTETSLQPTVTNDNLQEIADYVWNNLKFGKPGKEYTVFELKDGVDISELNRRFVELKEAYENSENIDNSEDIIEDFLKTFTNKSKVKEFVRRGEIPSQRAFLEDNTEIVKQYVINCK